jgi:hypothetical protein
MEFCLTQKELIEKVVANVKTLTLSWATLGGTIFLNTIKKTYFTVFVLVIVPLLKIAESLTVDSVQRRLKSKRGPV